MFFLNLCISLFNSYVSITKSAFNATSCELKSAARYITDVNVYLLLNVWDFNWEGDLFLRLTLGLKSKLNSFLS